MKKIDQDIKKIIKEKCREKNLSTEKLANLIGISRPLMYYYIGRGDIKILGKISEILGINTENYVDNLAYKKLEITKLKLNDKKKKVEIILSNIKLSIEEVEKKQEKLINKRQIKLFQEEK